MKPQLSLIIPVEKEDKNLVKTVSSYSDYLSKLDEKVSYEIIVVLNSNIKDTDVRIIKYSEQHPSVKSIKSTHSSGKGGSISLGFSQADGDFIGFVDSSGSISPSQVIKLFTFLKGTPWLDGVIGNRFKGKITASRVHLLLIKLYAFFVRSLFGFSYTDSQCGIKIFKRDAAKTIAKKISAAGRDFDANALLIAKYLNFRIFDYPVEWNGNIKHLAFSLEGAVRAPFELSHLKYLEISHKFAVLVGRQKYQEKLPSLVSKTILIFAWRDLKNIASGGSEVYVHEVAKRLAKKNRVILFTSLSRELSENDNMDGVEIFRHGGRFTVYFWAFIYYFTKFRRDADFIIDVENGIPFFTPLYTRKPKVMLLHHVHSVQWFRITNPIVAIFGMVMEVIFMPIIYKRTAIVTVSQSSKKDLLKLGFPEKKIFLAYNSTPPTGAGIGTVKKTKYPSLLYIGRVRKYKRLHVTIHVVSQLVKDFPDIKLKIGGTGESLEELSQLTRKLHLENNVEFLGFVSEEDKWRLMQSSWVFLMPSSKEGWGITIIEAASCGTPSVGFDVPGVRDSILDGITGLLAVSQEDFHLEVKKLITDADFRNALGRKCVAWSKEFSWNKTSGVFEKLMEHYFSKSKGLLSDKIYPWDVDLRAELITTLLNTK